MKADVYVPSIEEIAMAFHEELARGDELPWRPWGTMPPEYRERHMGAVTALLQRGLICRAIGSSRR